MGLMYDSTTAADIPETAEIVAGYINADYTWSDADWQRFPNAAKVRIADYVPGQVPPSDGDVLDMEQMYVEGDPIGTRAVAGQWVGDRVAAGSHPVIYTSLSTADNFRGLYCSFWIADYTGSPHMASVPGLDVVATQYASPATGSGGHYDLSVTVDHWPIPAGGSNPTMQPFKFVPTKSGKGYWICDTKGEVYAYGDAQFFGHSADKLTATLFDFVITPDEGGYWFVDGNCNVYSHGNAVFLGHP